MSSSSRHNPSRRIDSGIGGLSPISPAFFSAPTSPTFASTFGNISRDDLLSLRPEVVSRTQGSPRGTQRSSTALSSRSGKKVEGSKRSWKFWKSRSSTPSGQASPHQRQRQQSASPGKTGGHFPASASPSFNTTQTGLSESNASQIDWWQPQEPTRRTKPRPKVLCMTHVKEVQRSASTLVRENSSFLREDSSEEDERGSTMTSSRANHHESAQDFGPHGRSQKADPLARPDSGLFLMPSPTGAVDHGLHGHLPGAALTTNQPAELRTAKGISGGYVVRGEA